STQISALSLPQLREIMEVVIEAGAKNWQVALTVAMGRAADRPELLLQPDQLPHLFPLLPSLDEEAREPRLVLPPAHHLGYFGPYESQLRCVNDARAHWTGCSAGDNVLGIEADGTIKACPGLPSPYAGGNIRDKSLREIWLSSRELAFTRTRTTDELWGFCK